VPEIAAARRSSASWRLRSVSKIGPSRTFRNRGPLPSGRLSGIRWRLIGTTQARRVVALGECPGHRWHIPGLSTRSSWPPPGIKTLTRRATQLAQEAAQLEVMLTGRGRPHARRPWSPGRLSPVIEAHRLDNWSPSWTRSEAPPTSHARPGVHRPGVSARCAPAADDDPVQDRAGRPTLAGPLFCGTLSPIWSPEARTLISTDLGRTSNASRSGDKRRADPRVFRRSLARVPRQIVYRGVCLVLAPGTRRRATPAEQEPGELATALVFELPVSSALVSPFGHRLDLPDLPCPPGRHGLLSACRVADRGAGLRRPTVAPAPPRSKCLARSSSSIAPRRGARSFPCWSMGVPVRDAVRHRVLAPRAPVRAAALDRRRGPARVSDGGSDISRGSCGQQLSILVAACSTCVRAGLDAHWHASRVRGSPALCRLVVCTRVCRVG